MRRRKRESGSRKIKEREREREEKKITNRQRERDKWRRLKKHENGLFLSFRFHRGVSHAIIFSLGDEKMNESAPDNGRSRDAFFTFFFFLLQRRRLTSLCTQHFVRGFAPGISLDVLLKRHPSRRNGLVFVSLVDRNAKNDHRKRRNATTAPGFDKHQTHRKKRPHVQK